MDFEQLMQLAEDQGILQSYSREDRRLSINGAIRIPKPVEPKEPTLRDQFAMAAMQGILSNPETEERYTGNHIREVLTYEQAVAIGAHRIADAMMKAREDSCTTA